MRGVPSCPSTNTAGATVSCKLCPKCMTMCDPSSHVARGTQGGAPLTVSSQYAVCTRSTATGGRGVCSACPCCAGSDTGDISAALACPPVSCQVMAAIEVLAVERNCTTYARPLCIMSGIVAVSPGVRGCTTTVSFRVVLLPTATTPTSPSAL